MVVMAMNVELREKPRVFEVFIGLNPIGEVTSYKGPEEDEEEQYQATLFALDEDDRDIGWYATLREAALRVVEYEHGQCKIDAVVTRKV